MPEDDLKHLDIREVRVGDLMDVFPQTEPVAVRKDTSLKDVTDAMIDKSRSRKVYVVDENRKLLGTITFETLLRHAGYQLGVRKTGVTSFLRMLKEIGEEKASEVMTPPVKVLREELVVNAMKLMVEYHLNDLPVVDEKGRLIGELNGLDVLRYAREKA